MKNEFLGIKYILKHLLHFTVITIIIESTYLHSTLLLYYVDPMQNLIAFPFNSGSCCKRHTLLELDVLFTCVFKALKGQNYF